jgi:ribosomal-protein-alanine N-acetyltransferase
MVRLETERLILRDHELSDLAAFCEIESDPLYRWPQVVHAESELQRSFRQAWLPLKTMGLLATVFRPTNMYIGRCGLYPRRDDSGEVVPSEAEIAFYIARPYWNRGLATEAACAFVKYGFDELGLRSIKAGINAANAGSIRVVEKVGFALVRSGEGGGNRWHEFEIRNPNRIPAA